MKVLIVDDEPSIRLTVSVLLGRAGHEAVQAADGEEALKLLRSSGADLVLLDLMLPGISGLQVLAQIRADLRLAHLPVIILSSLSDRNDRLAGLEAGADEYLSKPVDSAELLTRLRTQENLARLRRRIMEELKRSNADLERYALAAAHDLKAPLQVISAAAAILADEPALAAAPDSAKLVSMIAGAGARMRGMLDSLLAYSRFGLEGRPFEPVACGEAWDEAAANLAPQISAASAVVTRGELPLVKGDRALLAQLFQNLISNAVKFRGQDAPAVSCSAQRRGGEWIISVKDNGIGIPAADLQRVFEMFTRLHSWDQFPGTGVGLATCRRIAELHGGRVWAESEPGKGSTFYLALPASEGQAAKD